MKLACTLLAAIFLLACNQPSKTYYVTYRVNTGLDLLTVSAEQDYIDTITAANDSAAYRKAFESFYWRFNYFLNDEDDEYAQYRLAPLAMKITDDHFKDLKDKLSPAVIVAIEKSILNPQETIEGLIKRVKAKRESQKLDTVGLYTAPVHIIKAQLIQKEYSSYKDISMSYKNISDKTISGVRFKWYGLNAFGEPADMGGLLQKGFGAGFDDKTLRPGKTRSGTWSINSNDGKSIVLAWPYEVAFEDGSKWELRNE